MCNQKICKNCGGTVFYKGGKCKLCTKEREARYRSNPEIREKKRLSSAAWYVNNRDRALASAEKKRSENPGLNAAYHAANKEKIIARKSAYRAANIEKERTRERLKNHNRRAAKGCFSADLVARLFKLQRRKCACCGLPLGDDYHLDHIMPLALGGKNEDGNMQLLRNTCNMQKYAKHPIDFMQSRGFLL